MRKFIGNVNGVEFTNKEDFDKAVAEVIKCGFSDNLLISSYYKEILDEDENPKIEAKVSDNNIVNSDSYLLTRDSKKNDDGTYYISPELKDSIKSASNKSDIVDELKLKIHANEMTINIYNKRHEEIMKEINALENEDKQLENDNDDAQAQIEYYKELKKLVSCSNCNCNSNNCKCKHKPNILSTKSLKNNKDAYELIEEVANGFSQFLNDCGFWKKL